MNAALLLSRILDSVTDAFTPDVARRIVALTADVDVQARIDELATKSNQGTLTDYERAEYRRYVDAIELVTLLQAKSQRLLDGNH